VAEVVREWFVPEWLDRALCAQVGADFWVPEHGKSDIEAKRICNGRPGVAPCPVRAECLEWALANDEAWGVFGGKSPAERRKLRAAS
jgi:WhiB family redox-sensing transcriptional regulator